MEVPGTSSQSAKLNCNLVGITGHLKQMHLNFAEVRLRFARGLCGVFRFTRLHVSQLPLLWVEFWLYIFLSKLSLDELHNFMFRKSAENNRVLGKILVIFATVSLKHNFIFCLLGRLCFPSALKHLRLNVFTALNTMASSRRLFL